jgi:undecaprenyl-diphosphatase
MDFISGIDWGTYYWIHAHPTPRIQPVMLELATLGSMPLLTLAVLLAAGCLLTLRHSCLALFVLAAVAGGVLLGTLLLGLTGSPRPGEATVDWLNEGGAKGFPDGSTLAAAVVYLTLALVLTPLVARRPVRAFFLGAAGLLVFLSGVSRVYLGLQFLSEMLAAWVGGLAWALACRGVGKNWFLPKGTPAPK